VGIRIRGGRSAFVGILIATALAAGSVAIVRALSGGSSTADLAVKGRPGIATAAPVVNFKRLALHDTPEARVLMGRERETLPKHWLQRQERIEENRSAVGPSADGGARQLPLEPSPAASSPALSANFNAVDDNNVFIPPDTEGAPGPDKLLITVNGTVRIEQKSDGSVLSTQTLNNFFSAIPGVGTVFDPHVLYDPYANRWIVVAVSNAALATADVLLAVSQTSDPAGAWNEYRVDVDGTDQTWGDYPTVGFNKNWIVVSLNMFTNSGFGTCAGLPFCGTQTYAFDKAKAYAGGGAYQLFTLPYPTFDDFSLSPTAMYDANATDMYLVEDYDGTGLFSSLPLRLFKISGPVGSATMTRLSDPSGAALSALGHWSDVWGSGVGFAPQLGSTMKIDNGDARLSQCLYRNASIWCANTTFLPSTLPTHSAVQWYEIDPAASTPNVVQAGRISDGTGVQFFAYPSVAVNKYNDALLGFSRFSASQYASADYAYRSCTNAPNTFQDEAVFQAGAGPYFKTYGGTRNRWGDYSGTWVDPSDDTSMWTIQEYAKAPAVTGTWGTWWGKLAAQAHAAPTAPSLASSDHTPGVASSSQVVHVSLTPADDCALSYIYRWSTTATDSPDPATDAVVSGNARALASPSLAVGSSWWLHLEAVNADGSASAVAHLGPFPIVSPPPPPPPPPPPTTTTTPPPQPPPPCSVPNVRGQTLTAAKTALVAAHCSAGVIRSVFSKTVAKGRVISQSAPPGGQLANGASIDLVVSKGPPPVKVTLCYRHRTVRVTKSVARKLRRQGAKLGTCRAARRR
jgi:hypothetical protein